MRILFLLLFLVPSVSFSQKYLTINIAKTPLVTINAVVSIEENIPSDTVYFMMGQNLKYQHITDIITLYSGDLKGLYSFLNYTTTFLEKDEPGITENYNGTYLSTIKIMGATCLTIYEEDNGSGYITFSLSQLKKLSTKTLTWATNNNLAVK